MSLPCCFWLERLVLHHRDIQVFQSNHCTSMFNVFSKSPKNSNCCASQKSKRNAPQLRKNAFYYKLLLLQIYQHKQIHFLNKTSMNTRWTNLCVRRYLCWSWSWSRCWCWSWSRSRRGFLFLRNDFNFLPRFSHCLSIGLGLLLRAHDSYTPTITNSSFPSSINRQCLKTTLTPWKPSLRGSLIIYSKKGGV